MSKQTVITAGAGVRRHVRRELQKLGVRFVEDKGFLDSQFVVDADIYAYFPDGTIMAPTVSAVFEQPAPTPASFVVSGNFDVSNFEGVKMVGTGMVFT